MDKYGFPVRATSSVEFPKVENWTDEMGKPIEAVSLLPCLPYNPMGDELSRAAAYIKQLEERVEVLEAQTQSLYNNICRLTAEVGR